jgi:hypothetical protein
VVDAPRSEARLGDLEAAALAQEEILSRHLDPIEGDLPMAAGPVLDAACGVPFSGTRTGGP